MLNSSASASNNNAGSTQSAPTFTFSGATWDGSETLSGLSGVSGVVNVGDWINVGGDYVGQVASTTSTTITLSITNAFGTVPAGGTYNIVDGGPWKDWGIFTNFGTSYGPGVSLRINIQAFTYTLSGNLTIGLKGDSWPIWIRGYNTTPGDLDNGSSSLSYPTISCGTYTLTDSSTETLWSGVAITANRNGAAFSISSNFIHSYRHCRFSNSYNSSVNGFAVSSGEGNVEFTNCYFASAAASSSICNVGSSSFLGCYFAGAGSGTTQAGITCNGFLIAIGNTFYRTGSYGIGWNDGSGIFVIERNTFYQCGSTAINLASNGTSVDAPSLIVNNLFVSSGTNGSGYDISGPGTSGYLVRLINNDSYNPASGHLSGFGDWGELNPLTESSNPVVSSSNLSLISSAVGAGAGIPSQWENVTGQAYPDVGAWQRQVTSGSGGILYLPDMTGGLNG